MLNLGLAYDALGQSDDAVKALSKAMEHEDASPGLLAEVLYHLGRVLYVSRLDLDRAISLLHDATRRDPNLVGAYYYVGRALRDSGATCATCLSPRSENIWRAGLPWAAATRSVI
jgi:tetratricopeptide (TPR) repeat protein